MSYYTIGSTVVSAFLKRIHYGSLSHLNPIRLHNMNEKRNGIHWTSSAISHLQYDSIVGVVGIGGYNALLNINLLRLN